MAESKDQEKSVGQSDTRVSWEQGIGAEMGRGGTGGPHHWRC